MLLGLLLLILLAAGSAFAAANTVPRSYLGTFTTSVTLDDLAPSECKTINFSNSNNQLILGTDSGETLTGGSGKDCIVAGDGVDLLFGLDGNDVLIGGPGFDICFGGAGNNSYYECEITF